LFEGMPYTLTFNGILTRVKGFVLNMKKNRGYFLGFGNIKYS